MVIGVGLDVGGTKTLGVAISPNGEIVAEATLSTPKTPDELASSLEECLRMVLAGVPTPPEQVRGVGIALPGLVGLDGHLYETPNLPAVSGMTVREDLVPGIQRVAGEFGNATEMFIALENDGTCAAAGEAAFGAGRKLSNFVVVTLGTGIGGGIVANGHLVRGAKGFAGEIGHFVIDVGGLACPCGNRGCWEQYASGTGLGRIARHEAAAGRAPHLLASAGGLDQIQGEQVVEAARAGSAEATPILAQYSRNVAVGLSTLAELLDPEVILLGGGLVRAADVFYDLTSSSFATYRRGSGTQRVHLDLAQLRERAGAMGAAAIALGLVD